MKAYPTKSQKISGSSYAEIERSARKYHNVIAASTKRNPYVRSAFFSKEKIFINLFWEHLNQKPRRDRKRRLKYYICAIDVLRNTTYEPESKQNPNLKNETVHRFAGITKDNEIFYVQVKENNKSKNKYLMSVFPPQ